MSGSPVSTQARPAVILMVEDNEDHVFLARESFLSAKLAVDFEHVDSGEKCLAFLRKEPPWQNAPTPDLILLDIHMPRMDGYEVMEHIAADPQLRHFTVIVLTSSSDMSEVNRMYALGCKSYLNKPVTFEGFTELIRRLAGYWLDLVILPTVGDEDRGPSGQPGHA